MPHVKSMKEARQVFDAAHSVAQYCGRAVFSSESLSWIEKQPGEDSGPLADCHVDHSWRMWWWQSSSPDLLAHGVVPMRALLNSEDC